ncbi:MAG: RagB/SusD family nutrient uptake outer membrane protein [Bacteroidales bacterium]|nr:RagB/SusD family nutrient uptake outer membrane protein [Bacteroidales bacterium]
MVSKKILFIAFCCLEITCTLAINGQGYKETQRIVIPDLPDYHTLECDFHTHTVFFDGLVWPTIRENEALRYGLDAKAITDHIEYQPNKKYVNLGHNSINEIASTFEENKGLIVIPTIETTRETPSGHCNVLFIENADKLVTEQCDESFQRSSYKRRLYIGIISHECRIELCLEAHRFYDARRWKIAKEGFIKPDRGIRIDKDKNSDTKVYNVFEYEQQIFPAKYFCNQSHSTNFTKQILEQNSGY